MRAVVTGCGGFIGSHLVERLLADGWDVVGLDCFNDNYARPQKLANLAQAREWDAFDFVPVDIAGGRLEDLLAGQDVVFHLAAEPGVRPSWGRRFEAYVRNNVVATQHLLEAAAATVPAPRFVYASSSSVYGSTGGPVAESATPAPFSPYGITKLAAEHLVQAYHANHGLPTVALRYFSVYGPRQRPDMAFHRFCRAALDGTQAEVFGDGGQTRDFTYVADIVDATVAAGVQSDVDGAVMNVGAGHQVSVRQAIELIERLTGKALDVTYGRPEPGDVRDVVADASRADALLSWTPAHGFEDGLRAQLEWLTAMERV